MHRSIIKTSIQTMESCPLTILDMPPEIIIKIFNMTDMTYEEGKLSGMVRFIASKFRSIFNECRTIRVSEISKKVPSM